MRLSTCFIQNHQTFAQNNGLQNKGFSMLVRNAANPLIRPQDIQASRSDFEVIGTFNAGAVQHGDEIMLLIRVAERPLQTSESIILCPQLSENGDILLAAI